MDRIQVGHIPSITWNRLKTNAAVIEKAPVLDVSVDTTFQKLPEGVSVKTMSPDDAAKWMKAHAPEEEPEKVVASKQPIYHPQAFATGLGEEYDTYMRGSLREVHLLEVKDGQSGCVRPDYPCRRGRIPYAGHDLPQQPQGAWDGGGFDESAS